MGNPNIGEQGIGSRFSSSKQPENRGRKPSKLKRYLKENNISKTDFDLMFLNVSCKTLGELKEMMKSQNQDKLPLIVAGFISACIHDVQNGTMHEINKQREFFHGKAAQKIEADVNAPVMLTPEERQQRIEELLKKSGI